MSEYLDDLRYAYYRNQDVEEAIYEAWLTAGEEWKLHLAVMEEEFFRGEIPELYLRKRRNQHLIGFLATCQCALRYGGDQRSN